MFAISERVRPCSARCSPRFVGRLMRIWPSSCSTRMSRWILSVSSPRGPLTVTRSGSIETVTPPGTGMGCLPIRDIALPDPRHDLAADALDPRVVAGHQPLGRGDDRGPHSALDAWDVVVVDVRPPAGPRDALEAGDYGLALGRVLDRHRDLVAGTPLSRGVDRVVLDVALLLEDPRDLSLEPRRRGGEVHMLSLRCVAQAR